MATISVRVEDDLKERAEDAAASEGLSVSEWTRQLMQSQLGLDVPAWSAPTSLSKRDRRQLALLHRIIEVVSTDEDEADYHRRLIEILEHGYAGEYGREFDSIYDELPLDECRLVWDLLDMFRVIGASVADVGVDAVRALDEHAEHALRFRGFDFNDRREGRLADYAEHLVRGGRWSELAIYFDDQHERGNSHMPALESYLRMLRTFKPMWDAIVHGQDRGRYLLSIDELGAIAKAWRYPR